MIPTSNPTCPYCSRPMQILTRVVIESKVTSISFGCSCRGTLYRENHHAGDDTAKVVRYEKVSRQ